MSKIIILGASNALPTQESENTHMVIVGADGTMTLVDVPSSNTILRLERAGVDFNNLTDIIITHFHPDHTLGLPALLLDMWIMGRSQPLTIHGLSHAIERSKSLLDLYDWSDWTNFFPVSFHTIPPEEMAQVADRPTFTIHSSPVHHSVPNIGLRVDFKSSQKRFVYSSDTQPCDEIIRLGAGADVLVHEAAGEFSGHSSARQAGEVAQKAGAGSLVLIHYPTGKFSSGDLVAEARSTFSGEVSLARDFMMLDFID